MRLSERLRELRTERGQRLVDLTHASGLSTAYLSDLERGVATPSIDTLTTLASAHGITVRDLLHGVNFAGTSTARGLPPGLVELAECPTYGPQLTTDWIDTLARIDHRGRRLRTRDEYLELFLHLRRVIA